jgi:hypothetical protein
MECLLCSLQKALANEAGLTGDLTANFMIGADGKVVDVDTTGVSGTVAACVSNIVLRLTFAKPKDDATVVVSYPLTFDLWPPQRSGHR